MNTTKDFCGTQLCCLLTDVVVIALYFGKSFDTVRHASLLRKMALLNVPDSVYNWLVDFFGDNNKPCIQAVEDQRQHCDLPCAASLAGIQPVRPRAQRTSP